MKISERALVIAGSIVVLGSRMWALARSPWDWDEMLFLLALRDYDVPLHHPHPPGFPLFIGAAQIFRIVGFGDFRALQMVNLAATIFIVPAMVLLCREVGFRFSTSFLAALIFAFLPNVWFYSETAFSDVAAVVAAIAACGLLMRGRYSTVALFAGALLLGVAAGMRPQYLVIAVIPFALVAWHRRRNGAPASAGAVLLTAAIVIGAYYAAAVLSGGWARYAEANRLHQEYIARTDSFASPIRPSLLRVSDDFFFWPFRAPVINLVVAALIAHSLFAAVIRRRWPIVITMGMFGPFLIGAWLILDFHSSSRFSIGYMPMYAILAADGIGVIAGTMRRYEAAVEHALAGFLIVGMILWTLPAVRIPALHASPPVMAVEWIRANVGRAQVIYVDPRLRPFADYFLPDYRYQWENPAAAAYRLIEGSAERGAHFSWRAGRLPNVARRRYLDVTVVKN